jgi:GNAT superfamily N-acetyltransferase
VSANAPTEPEPVPLAGSASAGLRVRAACREDLDGIVTGVRALLVELGGDPPPATAMRTAARALLEDPGSGAILVADADGEIVGVLGVSWQTAIHIPGCYGLIQDLWVRPSWRAKSIGRDLLTALFDLAHEQGVARLEVGLPRESFAGLAATESFYLSNGFMPLGPRMRLVLG